MAENKKRVTFVITSMGRGGAEHVISILSNYYITLGWKVSIVMLWHDIVGYELSPEVEVVNLSNDKYSPMLRMPVIASTLTKYLLKEKPDVVVSFIAENCLVTDLACRIAGVKHITSERIDPNMAGRNPLVQKAINMVYSGCHRVVLQTNRAKKFFSPKIQEKSVIIGNPIEVKACATEEKQKRIVAVGRLEKQKNHKMLINSFAEISKENPDFELEIYGDGSMYETLKQQIDELGLTQKAFLKGNVPDVHKKIADAYMFVLSSDFEGLSNALLEGMMMGLPCVSTNCAGSDEVITDGENGLLINVGDGEALTKAMRKLIEDEELARSMGKKARESTEKFAVNNIIDSWREVIESK